MDAAALRKLDLIEALEEEAQAAGRKPPNLPCDAPQTWTEDQLRAAFAAQLELTATSCSPQPGPARFPAPDAAAFNRWFPAYVKFRVAGCRPRLRIVCLPCAGSAEDMYTSEGTGARRVASPLLEWCRANGGEVLAAQPPGRGSRLREPCCGSAAEMAAELLPLLGGLLQDGVPWAIISHSMGCWVAFELLQRARAAGLPMPQAWFLSAMPYPSIPEAERPWRQQHTLDDAQFKEECARWDINDAVFRPGMWEVFCPLLRADFTVFDRYAFTHGGAPPFEGLALHLFYGTADRRVSRAMVQGWQQFTTGPTTCTAVEGDHLWALKAPGKQAWLQAITRQLELLA